MPFAFVYFYIYVLNHLEFIFVHCIGWGLFNSLNMLALCWNLLSLPFTPSFNKRLMAHDLILHPLLPQKIKREYPYHKGYKENNARVSGP